MTSSEPSESAATESAAETVDPLTPTAVSRPVDSGERASVAVVLAVASAIDVEPTELTPPLHAFVDPDAIDGLFAGSEDLQIAFDAYGCRVTVEGGVVDVRPLAPGRYGSTAAADSAAESDVDRGGA